MTEIQTPVMPIVSRRWAYDRSPGVAEARGRGDLVAEVVRVGTGIDVVDTIAIRLVARMEKALAGDAVRDVCVTGA